MLWFILILIQIFHREKYIAQTHRISNEWFSMVFYDRYAEAHE